MAIVWFFGLPCSGKSTIADWLKEYMLNGFEMAYDEIVRLDGDKTRKTDIGKSLGFSKLDRHHHVMRVASLAKDLSDLGVFVIASYITPFETTRKMLKKFLGKDLILVYVDCPLDKCIERDVKGMYKKALNGEIDNFTGISSPFDEPETYDLVIDSTAIKRKCFPKFVEDLNAILPLYW